MGRSGERADHNTRGTTAATTNNVYYRFGGLEETNNTSNSSPLITESEVLAPDGAPLIDDNADTHSVTSSNALYYNGHGDLAVETDTTGTVLSIHTYDPFGAPIDPIAGNNTNVAPNGTPERYTAAWDKQTDQSTNLIQMGARPYDPTLGRFYATDPIIGGSLNNYDYAAQDPINGYDLSGTRSDCDEPACLLHGEGMTEGEAEAQAKADAGRARNGETEATRWGKANHVGLEAVLGPGYDYNVWLGPGVGYADAVNWETNTVVELKPNNPWSIRGGYAQLDRYQAALEKQTGEKWTQVLERYQPYNGPH